MISIANNVPTMKYIIIVDKRWVYEFEVITS